MREGERRDIAAPLRREPSTLGTYHHPQEYRLPHPATLAPRLKHRGEELHKFDTEISQESHFQSPF